MYALYISMLIERIAKFEPKIIHPQKEEEILYGAQILTALPFELKADMLYLCTAELFEKLPLRRTSGRFFVVFGLAPEHIDQSTIPAHICLILIPDTNNILTISASLQEPFHAEQRVAAGMRSLTTALFANRGMQYLVDMAYSMLRNPIFIMDVSNRYIAAAFDESSVTPNSKFEDFLLSDILYGCATEASIKALWPQPFDQMNTAPETYHRYLHKEWGREVMLASVRVYGVPMGVIFMVAQEHPFGAVDEQYFTRLTFLAGLEFQKTSGYLHNRYGRDALFLIDLLTTSHADSTMLERRLSLLKQQLKSSMYLAVIQGRTLTSSEDQLQVQVNQLKELLCGHISAVFDGQLVILLSFKTENEIDMFFQNRVTRFLNTNDLVLGLSSEFQDLAQIRAYYQQAIRAAEMGKAFYPERDVIRFCEVTAMDLISFCGDHADLRKMLHPAITHLLAYDEKNNTEYLHTLETYLHCMANSKRTAQALHVHHNTVLYRLNKLSDILGVDIDDGENAFLYQLSLHMLKLLKAQGNGFESK